MYQKDIDYNVYLEGIVIASCYTERHSLARIIDILDEKCFYKDDHKVIYASICEMYRQNYPIDIITVHDYLLNKKGVKTILNNNTAYYLSKLQNDITSTAHLEIHAHILKRMWMQRELIGITNGTVKLDGEDVGDNIRKISKAIQDINSSMYEKDWKDMSELIIDLSKHQDKMLLTEGKGLTTGINKLDELNGGFFGGQMIILGARPSVGKSALMGQMAISMARKGAKVGIVSLEMNNNEIAARLSSIETQTDFKTIFRNLFQDENARAKWYRQITESFIGYEIYVTDNTKVTSIDIKSKALKLKHQAKGLDCIIVDYLQLVNSDATTRFGTRENEVSQISRTIKLMAKDLDIPIIVLCQLNRQSTHRTGTQRYPQLSDLRESGSLEQDADIVMFLHRDYMLGTEEHMKDENGYSTENNADLIVRKWRNGEPNLHIELEFQGSKMMFAEKGMMPIKPFETQDNSNTIDENPF